MKEFLKIFGMYLGVGFGAGCAGLLYAVLIAIPRAQMNKEACLTGWKHSALHYKVLEKQSPQAIIEYGKHECEWWYK